jgi:polyribonucleotide nucleotidyltransferase
LKENYPDNDVAAAFEARVRSVMRTNILERSLRMDGRNLNDSAAGLLRSGPVTRTHGSGLFNRGETQGNDHYNVGSMSERQQLDGLGLEETKALYAPLQLSAFTPPLK